MLKLWSACCAFALVLPACSEADDDKMMDESDMATVDAKGDGQTPPSTSGSDVEAWLDEGHYLDWACEDVEHPQMKVSPHGHNRVCSNDLTRGFDGAPGDERPAGSASVKELYDDASKLIGYAVAVKLAAKSGGGANWYWYERIGDLVTSDGLGSETKPKAVCVSCHTAAGTDDTHAVTGSSDFVYLQVDR
jgi:hypothetical protein